MTKYIDPDDGQIITLANNDIVMIDDSGVRKEAVSYLCHKRNIYFCESRRRFDLRYRKPIGMPDTGE